METIINIISQSEEIKALLLGLIQGLTEFLPISSSGHLLIFEEMLNMKENGLFMEVVLHGGTLVSIIIYYWSDLKQEVRNVINNNYKFMFNIIIATIPATIVAFLFQDQIIEYFFSSESKMFYLSMSYLFCAIVLFSTKFSQSKDIKEISLRIAILIGIAQIFALLPGISRSGMTIAIALMLGVNRKHAAKFSFILAIPIILFAVINSLINNYNQISEQFFLLIIGFLISAITGYYVISILVKLIERQKLWIFAIYCSFVSIILIWYNPW